MQFMPVARAASRWLLVVLLCLAAMDHREPHAHSRHPKRPVAISPLRLVRLHNIKVTHAAGGA